MRAILTVEESGAKRRFQITGPVVVGREPDCAVLLSDPTVSRRHASLSPADGGWLLRDLSSGNGTYLDGNRIAEAFIVGGECIRFGAIAARLEEQGDEALSTSQRLQLTLTQTLAIRPARRTRPKAVVITIVTAVLALLSATIYHRSCRGTDGDRPAAAAPALR